MPKVSQMEPPRMTGCFKDACNYWAWQLSIPVMIHNGWKIPQLMAASFPLSTPATAITPSLLHFPRLYVHAVRMESGSCDCVAFCIDDPA